ncbi:phosphate signaling complex protein PhoU [Parahalioglobus pacificus]|uniref:Phosphate-specific transport system accessory protein PhoU n=1 Tax=Parahalioglobus pacificus TaxID=930806 RepID=A0A919CIK4_9GAMM|nr:phosphate signaling complex protein PhoU [Halioglobus pacificus]GHD29045.1 phosphate transport system regulatory protein PhoU [Halioglobus pacificus]
MESRHDSYNQHISAQYNAELEALKNHLLEMGGLVEQQLGDAIDALLRRDSGSAAPIIDKDAVINQMQVDIDEECSRILARRQPAASDLRLVLTIGKLTNDLERVGDEASKLARLAIDLSEDAASPSNLLEVRQLSTDVVDMLHASLNAFARLEVHQAVGVVIADRETDRDYGSGLRSLTALLMEHRDSIPTLLNEIWALRSLERVGDHAANIAEQVIYLVRGVDVRHLSRKELKQQHLDQP